MVLSEQVERLGVRETRCYPSLAAVAGVEKLSVVLPVFNEAENVGRLHAELSGVMRPLGRPYEILYVDDGSTDGTAGLLDEICRTDPSVRVITFPENRGQTAALEAGFRAATGDLVVSLDADLQNDPADIPRLLAHIDGCDMVAGVRRRRRDSVSKRAASRIANTVRRWCLGDRFRDAGCTLKVYRRRCLDGIDLSRRGLHRFLPVLFEMEGFTVREVEVNHRPRRAGETKYNNWTRLWAGLRDMRYVRRLRAQRRSYRRKDNGQ